MNKYLKQTVWPALLALAVMVVVPGCDLLDVENPNNLGESDLANPAAAGPMANGVEAAVTRALGYVLLPYSVATDELTWVGSRDAWNQLDIGAIAFSGNEFTDQAFPYMGEARWLADDFAARLEAFSAEGAAVGEELARVYLYKAIIYTSIADSFDDFVISSDRTEAGMPVGPGNMSSLYDTAIAAADAGLAVNGGGNVRAALLGMKARALHAKAVWAKVNPVDTANPLVNAGVAEAQAALDAMGADGTFELVNDPGFQLTNYMASEINNRLENTFTDKWVQRNEAGNKVDAVTYPDLIDGVVHPYLDSYITGFVAALEYPEIPVVSGREMLLIMAEGALASGDTGTFTTHINALRDLDGLSPYTGQVDAQELLEESRAVNLYLQGRRLADMYRFDIMSPEWDPANEAVTNPGTFLPITTVEITANPNVN